MRRAARRTPWQARITILLDSISTEKTRGCAPPPLLPAPGAASFSTLNGTSYLGRMRQRSACPSAEAGNFSVPAKEAAAAGYKNQLDNLV